MNRRMAIRSVPGRLTIALTTLAVWWWLGADGATAAELRVPQQHLTLAAALAAATDGDTIILAEGTFQGGLTIDRPLTIKGAGQGKTTLTGGKKILTVNADVYLSDLTVTDGDTCIYVTAGRRLSMTRCAVVRGTHDGIGFAESAETVIEIRDCLIEDNGDGIDLEATQGLIVGTRFVANHDDGLDYDGNARVTVIGCQFVDNADDGIEIRLNAHTQAVITDCQFTGNGEDGLEIINTTVDTARNELILGRNEFRNNGRFGVGFVHATEEQAVAGDRSRCLTLWGPNIFAGNGVGPVSPNHLLEMQRAQTTRTTVTIQVTRGEVERQVTIPLHAPAPVGTIPLRPAINGPGALDLEGVAIDDKYIYLADDDTPGIHVVERATCHLIETVSTSPFPGSDVKCKGVEGLSLVAGGTSSVVSGASGASGGGGGGALFLADDDGSRLFTLDRTPGRVGRIIATEIDEDYAPGAEGVEQVGETLYFAYGHHILAAVDAQRRSRPNFPVSYIPQDVGRHVAGVGFDGRRILLSVADYNGERKYSPNSFIMAVDPQTGDPLEAWHIPYSNDPRGVACRDGLVYIADGMEPYHDQQIDAALAPGIRVLIFALDDPTKVKAADLPHRQLVGP